MLREGTCACFTSGPFCSRTDTAPVEQSGPGELMSYSEDLHSAALAYHRLPRPGKLEIQAIKPLANQRDLALAYSPGVAAACTEIANNPSEAASLTARANLVAVVSNGTAVLGLGNIGRHHRTRSRDGGGAGTDLRRHQSRGHQGTGVF